MLSIKSLKTMQVLRTQKMIREQIQKEDFFDNLIIKIQEQFNPSQYQYLINYVIPKKNDTKSQKKPLLQTYKNVTFDQKQNNYVFDAAQTQSSKIQQDRSFQNLNSKGSQNFQRQMKHFFTEQIKKIKRKPDNTKTAYSLQSNKKISNSLNSKKTITRKFKQVSLIERGSQTLDQSSHIRLSKRSKKTIQENLFTRQNIKRSYNQKFLKSIMKTETYQDQFQNNVDFNQTAYLPTNDFWLKEKEKDQIFRHFTSIKFQGSPKVSRLGPRIFTRRF